jgi:hypothetical protein
MVAVDTPTDETRALAIPTPRKRGVVRALVISLLLAVAVAGLWISFAQTRTHEGPKYVDAAIEAVYPGPGDLELRQTRVGVDLQVGYTAVLFVDGREIPEDQLERVVPLGQVFYTPAVGKETGALAPGRHCGTALLWREVQKRETGRKYSWCFNVH